MTDERQSELRRMCEAATPGPWDIVDGSNDGRLRDYFAAKFAAAWVVALSARTEIPAYCDSDAAVEACRLGLLQADAMLAAQDAEADGQKNACNGGACNAQETPCNDIGRASAEGESDGE